ncbi:uncharacterized protein [Malus domestica]|uniref:uncharacterized protein n=1 Tax=Malus domestica TaxID=3750 RepID=UPI0039750B46
MAEGGRGWVVECSCGATNDDNEPMIQYDKCQHWYHNISLCDLEKQIGKENHAEHASQCAPEQGLDKENHAEHAPLCVPEKCIEKEYQEILSFRNVLSKLSLEEQKLIEGYWTNATQTGDLFWNGLDSHNRTVGREDLGHLLSDAEISNGVVDSYAVLLTEDMLRDGVSNQFVMSRYAWMFVEDENEEGKQLHMSHPLLATLGDEDENEAAESGGGPINL